jgi:hypothetical protein
MMEGSFRKERKRKGKEGARIGSDKETTKQGRAERRKMDRQNR